MTFTKVPVGNYILKVSETEEFEQNEKQVQILVEEERVYEK